MKTNNRLSRINDEIMKVAFSDYPGRAEGPPYWCDDKRDPCGNDAGFEILQGLCFRTG